MVFNDFVVGNEYSYKEINVETGFEPKPGGYSQKGIILVPRKRPKAIMIKMNLEKNLYGEEFQEGSSVLHYIGEGLPDQGHQKLKGGNKRIVNNMDQDVFLFVHHPGQQKGFWTYHGIWRIASYDPEYETSELTPNGELQRVYRFRLLKKKPILGTKEKVSESSNFGPYRTRIVFTESCSFYVSKIQQEVDAQGYITSVTGPYDDSWEILVILPLQGDLPGQVTLLRPATLRDPFLQVLRKSMMVNPVDPKEGFYVSELKRCHCDEAGRLKCKQIPAAGPYPESFATSGIKPVRYSDYRKKQRTNLAAGWVFSKGEVEKMALCFYLGRIFPFLMDREEVAL